MKFVIAFLLLFPCVCFAQKNSDSLFFAKMETHNISRSTEIKNQINIPFNSLIVNDVRADITSIGFFKLRNSGTKKLNFSNGLVNEIDSFSKNNYVFNNIKSDSTILCVYIKNFRVSDFADEDYVKQNNIVSWRSGLILNAEIFLFNKGSYRALYKIDTVFSLKTNVESLYSIPSEVFHIIFYKVENKSFSEIHVGKKEFSYQQICDHVNEVFNSPILKDSILKRGIYKTFAEFKNNKPSITNFEIKTGKFSDELYITENNQTYPLQDFWGYSDDVNLFIRSADNSFQLIRVGNTFNTVAFKSLQKRKRVPVAAQAAINLALSGVPAFSMKGKEKYKAFTSAFQLDMQTGEIF